MKRTVTLPVMRVMAALMLLVLGLLKAQAQTEGYYFMNVYQKDGSKVRYVVRDIESVNFTFEESLLEGLEYVDLGLSVNWATFNVGATSPEETGDYYQWGAIDTSSQYILEDYRFYVPEVPASTGDDAGGMDWYYSKYVTSRQYGTVDNKYILEPEDDVASVKWGFKWRIPTITEFEELRYMCTWEWTEQNGVEGYLITSDVKGYEDRSIFLPATGYMYSGKLINTGYGTYWSSSLYNSSYAYYLNFNYSSYENNNRNRCYGMPVRPVVTSDSWRGITSIALRQDTLRMLSDSKSYLDLLMLSGDMDYTFKYYKEAVWSSDNPDIVSVDDYGNLATFRNPGKAIITVRYKSYVAKCVVVVDEKPLDIRFGQAFEYMKALMPVTGDGAQRHNDFGYASVMMFTDANGFDVVSEDNGYNWTGNELDYSDRNANSYDARIIWEYLYKQIFKCNDVISHIDLRSQKPEDMFMLGQMCALRAFCYWNLAQLYQFNYTGNQNMPCVPIITERNQESALENGCARATVAQVYTQIMNDMNSAVNLLQQAQDAGAERADKRYIDLSVAYGLRSRVNLTMGNWADAASDAQAAINASAARPSSIQEASRPAFWTADEPDWMWGIIVDETDAIVESGIVNYPSHMGSFNWGYSWYSGGRQINRSLFNSISATDVRKGWWIDDDGYSPNLTSEQIALIADYFGEELIQVKFAPYKNKLETDINANDIPLMRIEEMYLIIAECKARMGQADAVQVLENFVTTYRDPQYSFATPAADAQSLVDEIWRQRRIEFWGEGLSWFDIMRLGKGVDRRGAGYPDDYVIFNIAADDPILLWRIPDKEIESNPLISEDDNNPACELPQPVDDYEY